MAYQVEGSQQTENQESVMLWKRHLQKLLLAIIW